MKIKIFFKCDTFESDTILDTFEIFGKCLESVNFDTNNDLQEDLKIFKSDTFENYKSFASVEVQSLCISNSMIELTIFQGFMYYCYMYI